MNLKRLLRFAVPLTCLFSISTTATAAPLAFTATNYFVAPSCYTVSAGDFNGDGKLDLISACGNVSRLVILTNSGNGQFASNSILSDSHFLGDPVVAADFNGDGKVDIACLAGFPSVVIMTNNGSGGFGFLSSTSVGLNSGEFGLAAADVNGDNKIDLVCANGSDNKLYVLTNNGGGFFGTYSSPSVGSNPMSVAVGDIDGDGRPDLIAANAGDFGSFGTTLTVVTNNGSGFGFKATLSVGTEPTCVVAADVDSNGSLDLISANDGSGTLTVLTNNSHGVFGLKTNITVQFAFAVVAADLNGDGKADLACTSDGNRKVMVFTNNGAGVFGSNTVLTTSTNVADYQEALLAADVDGDGQMDLIAGNQNYSGTLNANVAVFTQTAINPPTVSIGTSNATSMAISWSTPSTTFVLQTNGTVSGGNWAAANYPIATNGQNRTMIINPTIGQNLFFRLKR